MHTVSLLQYSTEQYSTAQHSKALSSKAGKQNSSTRKPLKSEPKQRGKIHNNTNRMVENSTKWETGKISKASTLSAAQQHSSNNHKPVLAISDQRPPDASQLSSSEYLGTAKLTEGQTEAGRQSNECKPCLLLSQAHGTAMLFNAKRCATLRRMTD